MSSPTTLCSTCLSALQSGLEDIYEKTIHKDFPHHASLSDLEEAAAQECYICAKFMASIRSEVLAGWSDKSLTWHPLKCSLSRRPWAPERYGAIYWHIVYFEINIEYMDMSDLKYRGNVFCLFKNAKDAKTSSADGDVKIVEPSTASLKVHEQAYEWYKGCVEYHEICKKLEPRERYTPTRLLDVGVEGDDTWKLCLSSEDIVEPPDYLTLSYRWASNPKVLLLSSTIDEFRRGAPIAILPKTFVDAITVARNFSIRYLWIDSLCIIQDSPEDWTLESTLMHDVYAGSCCNISASASENPESGLFRSREPEDVELGKFDVELPNYGTTTFEIWDEFFMERLTYGPLLDRGWVFQERVLAPRILHFSYSQVAWECTQMNKCETFTNFAPYPTETSYSRLKTLHALFNTNYDSDDDSWLPEPARQKKVMNEDVYEQWRYLLKTYSQCALTRKDDRLIAMAGIAKMFERQTGDEYIAGLWKSRLIEGLNWVVVDPVAQPQNRFRAPSWSWAAVDSGIEPQKSNWPRNDGLIEIINAKVTLSQGQESSGFIELRGCLTKAIIQEGHTSVTGRTYSIKLVGLDSKFYVLPDTTDVLFIEGNELHLLPLRSTLRRKVGDDLLKLGTIVDILEGMIIEHVGDGSSYRRIGRFVLDDLDHVEFLGLHASPHFLGSTTKKIVVDDAKVSLMTLS